MSLFGHVALLATVVGVDGEEPPLAVGRQPEASAEHAVADRLDVLATVAEHLRSTLQF